MDNKVFENSKLERAGHLNWLIRNIVCTFRPAVFQVFKEFYADMPKHSKKKITLMLFHASLYKLKRGYILLYNSKYCTSFAISIISLNEIESMAKY